MRAKYLIFAVCSFLLLPSLNAQHEGDYWYFGENAGLHFSGASPTVLTNGALNTYEGCATISDATGNLLFYTDGRKVYNANHDTMANGNGLLGGFSSTQAAAIVPAPGSPSLYYIFTTDNSGGQNGLRYSLVDMGQQGGLGAVIQKNILLYTPVTEKLIAVKHANNQDIWVIAHEFNSDAYLAYRVSPSGVDTNAVVSHIGSVQGTMNFQGYLKASPDGTKLAAAISILADKVEIFSFDTQNGTLSNLITIPNVDNPYGIEFSPDGTKLYVSSRMPGKITQYTLNAGSQQAIINSAVTVYNGNNPFALQLAPDGKIYVAFNNSFYLSRIESPNLPGSSCNYQSNAVFLGGKRSKIGLPAFIPNYFQPGILASSFCFGSLTQFQLTDTSQVDSVLWNFGDTASSQNTSASLSAVHTYSDTGHFTVTVQVYHNGGTTTATSDIYIEPIPQVNFGNDTTICATTTIILNAGNPGALYTWSTGDSVQAIQVNTSGTYWVEVTTANGCVASDTVQITVLPPVILQVSKDTAICKNQSVQLHVSGAQSYQWQPASSLSDPAIADPVASPAYSTQYTVTGTDVNQCTGTATVLVHVYPLPNYMLPVETSICLGDTALLNAPPANSYQWTPQAWVNCDTCQQIEAMPQATTIYTVTYTNSFGCQREGLFTVHVAALPVVSAGPDVQACAGTSVQLQGSASDTSGIASYLWTPSQGLSSTTIPDPFANPAASTAYVLTATNTLGCSASDTVQFTRDQLSVDAGQPVTVCPGSSVQLQAIGSTIGSWDWKPASLLDNPHIANPTATVSQNTVFTVTLTNANGCVATDSVEVSVFNPLTVEAGKDTFVCQGESLQLQASGSGFFTWDPAPGLSCLNCSNPVASPVADQYYYVTVSGVNGCTARDSVFVKVRPAPVVSVPADTSICPGESVQLSATGGQSYQWAPMSQLSCATCSSPMASPVVSTLYTVTVSDAFGCQNKATVKINLKPKPTISYTGTPELCEGGSTQLQLTGASNYSWTPAAGISCTNCPDPVFTPTQTTTYTVNATGSNECQTTLPVTIQVKPAPTLSVTPDTAACSGSSIQLFASGGSTYQWSPASGLSCSNCPDPVAIITGPVTYQVTAIGSNGCTTTDSVHIGMHPAPVISVSPDDTVCLGNNLVLQASGAQSYTWTPLNMVVQTGLQTAVVYPTVTTTFTVTGTNAWGCEGTSTVTVYVQNGPTIQTSSDTAICLGESITLHASGGTQYSWSPSTGLSCTQCPDPVATPQTSTLYTVSVSDPFGCPGTGTVKVTVNPLPAAAASPDQAICEGASTGLWAGGGVQYHWFPSAGLSNPNDDQPLASPTSTTTYTVIVTGINGCRDSAFTTIQVNKMPVAVTSSDTTVCRGVPVNLIAGGGNSYQWIPPAGLNQDNIPNPVASPQVNTTYTVIVSNGTGCSDTGTVSVSLIEPADPGAIGDTVLCRGSTAVLAAFNGISYEWAPAISLDCSQCSAPLANPEQNTMYTVTITDINGCRNADSVLVQVRDLPVIEAGEDITLKKGEAVRLHATGGVQYYWSPEYWLDDPYIADPVAVPEDTVTYTVIGKDAYGCENSDELTIFVVPQSLVIIPNAFSPNGDGLNDIFHIGYSEGFTLEQLMIFNRWGELVFSTTDAQQGWDGTFMGHAQPIGSYLYVLKGTAPDGTPIRKSGNITLLK